MIDRGSGPFAIQFAGVIRFLQRRC